MPEMVKIERRPRRKMLEDPGPRSPAPPPSSRGTPYGASEVTAESRLVVTEALRNRQDKISGATAALGVAGEEPGARAPSGESLQQQGPPGTGASSKESPQQQGPPGTRAFRGESFQQRKMINFSGDEEKYNEEYYADPGSAFTC